MKNNRDIDILQRIVKYCSEITEAGKHFGNTLENLESNVIYKNAVAMCILQIGELTSVLSDEFKQEYNKMPWRDIKAMRNIVAHKYGVLDVEILWNTIVEDIPSLEQYCKEILEGEIGNQ